MGNLLASATVLVVEDEPLISLDMESILDARGATVVCAESLDRARHALAGQSVDAAVLDVRLPDGDSFPLAREFIAAGGAVVFVTGYAPGIPDDLRGWPIVEKPFTPEALAGAVLEGLVRRSGRV